MPMPSSVHTSSALKDVSIRGWGKKEKIRKLQEEISKNYSLLQSNLIKLGGVV